jgi:hypothetical protein
VRLFQCAEEVAPGPNDDLFVRGFGVAAMTGVEVTLSATSAARIEETVRIDVTG